MNNCYNTYLNLYILWKKLLTITFKTKYDSADKIWALWKWKHFNKASSTTQIFTCSADLLWQICDLPLYAKALF